MWFSAIGNPSSHPHATNLSQDLESQEHDGISRITPGPLRKGGCGFAGIKANLLTPRPTSQDAFFQPYLPLQQLDMIKESKSWLCGTTNSIVGQQKEIDLFVDVSPIDHMTTSRYKGYYFLTSRCRLQPEQSSFETKSSKSQLV